MANPLEKLDEWLEKILLNYRWLFVILFLLPISVLYEIGTWARNRLVLWLNSAPELHASRVREVQRQVKQWRMSGKDGMCTARPSWQTMSFRRGLYKASLFNVHLDMYDILDVNLQENYVRVEPMVTMGQLSKALIPLGLSIPAMPEIDDLTVGGLIMGCGIESSSHKYGLFQRGCLAFELVLQDGSVRRCSRDENPELFYAIPWSHGTLGFLVSADIRLIRVPQFVQLCYRPLHSLGKAAEAFRQASFSPEKHEFVEALLYSKDRGVLITGQLVEQKQIKDKSLINPIGRWYKPWFFKHAEDKVKNLTADDSYTEYVPLRDYYHRHTRSLFWELQDIISFGNHPIFRFLLGWTMPPKVSLLKLTQTKSIKKLYETSHVIQDLLLPIEKLEDAVTMLHELVEVYPLWLCPFLLTSEPGFVHSRRSNEEMYVDIGIYGVPRARGYEAKRTTRAMEKFVIDNHGYQMLYADTYTTRDEFRKMFDHTLYDRIRKNLDCEKAFPEVYNKVNKNVRI